MLACIISCGIGGGGSGESGSGRGGWGSDISLWGKDGLWWWLDVGVGGEEDVVGWGGGGGFGGHFEWLVLVVGGLVRVGCWVLWRECGEGVCCCWGGMLFAESVWCLGFGVVGEIRDCGWCL